MGDDVTKGIVNGRIGNAYKRVTFLSAMCLLSSCAVTNDYQPPEVNVPSEWRSSYQGVADTEAGEASGRISVESATALADAAWWETFGDETLNGLIRTAINENKDLRIAMASVEEFYWRVQSTDSRYYPQVGFGAAAYRDQRSLETSRPLVRNEDRVNDNFQASLFASWELDVWGRIKRANEAARADLLAAEEGRRAVVLTLVSTLAESYIELLSLDRQLEITRQTLHNRGEEVKIFEIKSDGGQISDLEIAQVRSAFEEVAVNVAPLEAQIAQQENFISVLLGRNPMKIERETKLNKLVMPEVPYGLPSTLLKRRPDVLQGEQGLIAANASVGITQTQYYPSFSLTGLLGYASTELSNLIQGSASMWAYGATLAGPLFTGGRIEGEVKQAQAQYEQRLNKYLKTVQNAFREVNDALVVLAKLKEQEKVEKRRLGVVADYLRFAQSRYDSGYTPYITVFDSQRQLYRAEIEYVRTKSRALKALVQLYKVLGGGWVDKAEEMIEKPGNVRVNQSVKIERGGLPAIPAAPPA